MSLPAWARGWDIIMIEATVKHKIPEIKYQEDCLTSTVWGLLKYQPLRPILADFIARAVLYTNNSIDLGSIISSTRFMTDAVTLEFWKYDQTYPQCQAARIRYGLGDDGKCCSLPAAHVVFHITSSDTGPYIGYYLSAMGAFAAWSIQNGITTEYSQSPGNPALADPRVRPNR